MTKVLLWGNTSERSFLYSFYPVIVGVKASFFIGKRAWPSDYARKKSGFTKKTEEIEAGVFQLWVDLIRGQGQSFVGFGASP